MILALAFFALGLLILTPELSLAAASDKLVSVKAEKLETSYAANAGIEYGLCLLSNPNGTYNGTYKLDGQGSDPAPINGMTVTLTIGSGSPLPNLGNNVYSYPITSQAMDLANGETFTMQAQGVQIQTLLGTPPNQYYEVIRQ
jgi:hypothetical protein